ncbi:sensor histidine kinase [Flammeovirga sp. MY04]|uniref:sensor histidine kinase n=1 Tax=Flammeovirga sp. MY04 TaxID=1191459 RepID=UPI00080617D4|nr:sensor histidine kinase [Flammeovirga sp. MY04]ANQ52323.1 sensor histidine kinase [Flammeovirga sp. MY04]
MNKLFFGILLFVLPFNEMDFDTSVQYQFYRLDKNFVYGIDEVINLQDSLYWTKSKKQISHNGYDIPVWYKLEIYSEWEGDACLYFDNVLFNKLNIFEITNNSNTIKPYMLTLKENTKHEITKGSNNVFTLEKGEKKTLFIQVFSKGFPSSSIFDFLPKERVDYQEQKEFSFRIFSRIIIFSFLVLATLLSFITRYKIIYYFIINQLFSFLLVEIELGYILSYFDISSEILIRVFQFTCLQFFITSYIVFFYKVVENENSLPNNLLLSSVISLIFFSVAMCVLFSNIFNQTTTFIFLVMLGLSYILNLGMVLFLNYKALSKKTEIGKIVFFINIMNLILIGFQVYSIFEITSSPFSQRSLYYLLAITNTISCFLALLFYTIKIYNKRSKLEIEQKQLMQAYSNAILSGQEKERIRIGRELHDFVGGNLSLINKVNNLSKVEVKDILKRTAKDVEELKMGLLSVQKNEVSNETLFLNLFENFHSDEMNCFVNFEGKGFDDISSKQINHIYRITQELLHNAKKHSQASLIIIGYVTDSEKNKLYIHYSDNGIGFKDNKSSDGVGIKNIKYRTKEIGGQLSINSTSGGTSIILSDILIKKTK